MTLVCVLLFDISERTKKIADDSMQQTTGFQKGTNLKKCKIFKHLQVAFNMIYGQAFNIHEIFDTLWSSMFTTTKLIDSFHKGLVKFWRPTHSGLCWGCCGQRISNTAKFCRWYRRLLVDLGLLHQDIRRWINKRHFVNFLGIKAVKLQILPKA